MFHHTESCYDVEVLAELEAEVGDIDMAQGLIGVGYAAVVA